MHERGLIGTELDLSGFYFLHSFAHVEGHGAGLRIGHQAFGAEHFTEASDGLHYIGRGNESVEVGPVFLGDLLDHLFAAGKISTGRFGFSNLVAGRDDQNFFRLTESVRQNDGAADHLVGVLGIDSQAHGDLDGFVELGEFNFLQEWNGILQNIGTRLDGRVRLGDILSFFFLHCFSLSPTADQLPISRGDFDNLVIEKFSNWVIRFSTTQFLADYLDAHRSCRTANALNGSVDGGGVEVGHFLLGDIFHLLGRDLAYFIFVRRA